MLFGGGKCTRINSASRSKGGSGSGSARRVSGSRNNDIELALFPNIVLGSGFRGRSVRGFAVIHFVIPISIRAQIWEVQAEGLDNISPVATPWERRHIQHMQAKLPASFVK